MSARARSRGSLAERMGEAALFAGSPAAADVPDSAQDTPPSSPQTSAASTPPPTPAPAPAPAVVPSPDGSGWQHTDAGSPEAPDITADPETTVAGSVSAEAEDPAGPQPGRADGASSAGRASRASRAGRAGGARRASRRRFQQPLVRSPDIFLPEDVTTRAKSQLRPARTGSRRTLAAGVLFQAYIRVLDELDLDLDLHGIDPGEDARNRAEVMNDEVVARVRQALENWAAEHARAT